MEIKATPVGRNTRSFCKVLLTVYSKLRKNIAQIITGLRLLPKAIKTTLYHVFVYLEIKEDIIEFLTVL